MVETVRHDEALRLALQRVVANLICRVQRLFKIALLKYAFLRRRARPDAGEAVGLQFDADRHGVRLALAHALAHLVELRQNSGDVLHMVADLVRQHIGLRKVALGAELARQLVIEAQVDIDLLVARTVERPGGGAGKAAGRADLAVEQDQRRLRIFLAHCLENAGPCVLGLGQDNFHKSRHFIILRARARRCRRVALRQRAARIAAGQHLHRINAAGFQDEEQHHQHDNAGNAAAARRPHARAAAGQAEAAAPYSAGRAGAVALILNVLAFAPAFPKHFMHSQSHYSPYGRYCGESSIVGFSADNLGNRRKCRYPRS